MPERHEAAADSYGLKGVCMGGDSRVTRISRLLSALEAEYDRGRDVVRLVELSTAAKIPLTTTYRLVGELCMHRIVERVSDGYRLGSRLFELGERALPVRNLRDTALPYLADLGRLTDSATHLGILRSSDILFIAKVANQHHRWIPTKVGGRAPAKCTALGKAILAHGGGHEMCNFTDVACETDDTTSSAEIEEFRRTLAEVRGRGYAIDRGSTAKELGCVATPVRICGEVVAAVSCSMELHRLRPERLAPALQAATEAIARSLTPTPTGPSIRPVPTLLSR
jgi:DNA-binding IclR family transcriptional regulator